MSLDPLGLAVRLARIFERLGVRYLLGGSLASTTFGEPRATLDVDFVADLQDAHIAPLLQELGTEFFHDEPWMRDAVRSRRSFQLVHRESLLRIDVFVPPWTGLHAWKWETRRRIDVRQGDQIDVTGPEGIVLQKLLWYRSGGDVSDRQWRDVAGVLKTQRGTLDMAALQRWAAELAIGDLLRRALDEAGVARS